MKEFISIIILIMFIDCNKKPEVSFAEIGKENLKQESERREYILNDSSRLTPYPFQKEFKKSQEEYLALQESLKEEGIMIDYFPEILPEFYIIDIQGDSVKLADYFKSNKCDFPIGIQYHLSIDIDWTGEIWRIELINKKGHVPNDFSLIEFLKRMKATPAIQEGKAIPFRIVVPLSR